MDGRMDCWTDGRTKQVIIACTRLINLSAEKCEDALEKACVFQIIVDVVSHFDEVSPLSFVLPLVRPSSSPLASFPNASEIMNLTILIVNC